MGEAGPRVPMRYITSVPLARQSRSVARAQTSMGWPTLNGLPKRLGGSQCTIVVFRFASTHLITEKPS